MPHPIAAYPQAPAARAAPAPQLKGHPADAHYPAPRAHRAPQAPPPHKDNFQATTSHTPAAAAPKGPEAIHINNTPEERKAKIHAGVQQLRHFTADGKFFHSSSSKAWEGMGKAGGLVPATMLRNYGVKRVTGEGDMNARKEKRCLFFGEGPPGLGMAMAYFELNQKSTNFSPHLYGNKELNAELSKTHYIVENWNLPPEGHFVDETYDNFTLTLKQAKNHLRQLETEKDLRDKMPYRRRNTRPYPMMFDLVVDAAEKKVKVGRANDGTGEAVVDRPLMFKDHLQRVFVPVNNIEHAQKQLDQILGRDHSVVVIPMESLLQKLLDQRDQDGDSKAATALRNKDSSYKGLKGAEGKIAGLYDEAVATLPMNPNDFPAPSSK